MATKRRTKEPASQPKKKKVSKSVRDNAKATPKPKPKKIVRSKRPELKETKAERGKKNTKVGRPSAASKKRADEKLFKERSKRAKKGWRTRKKKKVERVVRTWITGARNAYEQRVFIVRRLSLMSITEMTEEQIYYYLGYAKKGGKVGKHFSTLRMHPDATPLIERLRMVGNPYGNTFRLEAQDIAEEYNVRLNEVYTLFFS